MSYRIEFNQADNCCYIYYAGNVTLIDLKRVFLDFIEHPNFKKDMNLFVDFEMAEHTCSPAELINFFSFQELYEDKRGRNYKVVFVCPQEEAFSQTMNLVEYARSMPYSINVFRSKEEAFNWLKES